MRAVVQRVAWARCVVEGQVVGECGPGFLVFVGAGKDSTVAEAHKMADRVAGMRVFGDEEGKMNRSLADLEGDHVRALVISNFTLYGDAYVQRRPSFMRAAPYEKGERLYREFVDELARKIGPVATGVFGAHMDVESLADGPVTVLMGV